MLVLLIVLLWAASILLLSLNGPIAALLQKRHGGNLSDIKFYVLMYLQLPQLLIMWTSLILMLDNLC
jgi:hypothetical protein